jgi:cytochrome c-type biogenesis protein CcmH
LPVLLWLVIAVLTALAVFAVLLPLGRERAGGNRGRPDRAVYRDQLDELERDLKEGRIAPAEGEAARAEIARRLIAAERETPAPAAASGSALWRRRAAASLALVGVPAVALGVYLSLGAPQLPGQPLAARLNAPPAEQSLPELIARIEDHLSRRPEDGRGWEVLAPVYMRLERFDAAARAWQNAVRLLGSTPEREAALGEAITAAEGGIVTAEARRAFERALAAAPEAPHPRFYLALAKQQQGDVAAAVAEWRRLLAEAPADAPWRGAVEQAVAQAEAGGGSAEAGAGGPSAEDVATAAELSAGERQAMIDGMVARLADRLEREPDDVAGWMQLIRAYSVLGRQQDAAAAAGRALQAVRQQEDRAQIETLVADLGLAIEETGRP